MRLVRLLPLIFLPLVAAVLARAQSVRWEPAESGMANAIVLVYENCEPDGQPELPPVPGATFTPIGRTESMNMVNFQTTRSVMLSYLVRGRQGAPVQIPAFTVKTSAGPQRVAAFNAAAPAAPLESVASSRLIPERTSVWVGEVFGLNYELSASRRTNPQISPTFDWNAAPLVAEDWSKPEVTEGVTAGDRRVLVLFRTRAVAKAPATLKLDAASHLLSIQTGTIAFGGLLTQPRMEQVSVTSDQPTVEVRALPPAPPGFSGAVGQFKLVSKIVPEKAAVGEPITWTLELSGTGNWPEIAGLTAREVSNDFQVVQPKAKRTPAEGKLFDVTLAEDVVLVPAKSGSYALGPISFTYFDPKSGSYKTISAPRTTVTIASPAVPQINLTPLSSQANEGVPPASERRSAPPAAPAAPAGIPRDPLPGVAEAGTPWRAGPLAGLCLAPFAALLVFWGWLAVRRARATDPLRPRREARERLAATLEKIGSPANSPARPALLLQWQRDAAVLWQIALAAPRAEALADPAWSALWREADRALYGAKLELPADWVARAQAALAVKRVPAFNPLRLFLPRNLLPFAALIALALVPVALLRAAELDAAAAYRKGDFAAAEKSWRAALAQSPTNWIARHNLALALVQQERPAEAAAHAAAAFVQHPADPSVRWHFALAAEKSGAVPAPLAAFLHPGAGQSVAELASPAQWQGGLIAAACVAAVALGVLLAAAYGRATTLTLALAWSALALSAAAAALAFASGRAYGMTAHPDATLVARATTLRSLPTEADTQQKTSPLAAGSLALADKTFLGWTRLAFANGQTGWVRTEELVPIWK